MFPIIDVFVVPVFYKILSYYADLNKECGVCRGGGFRPFAMVLAADKLPAARLVNYFFNSCMASI